MDARPEDAALSALLRLIEVHAPGARIAIYALHEGSLRPRCRTHASAVGDHPPQPLEARAAALLAAGGRHALDGAALGIAAGPCILQTIRVGREAVGAIIVTHVRHVPDERLTAALADAAQVAGPMLAAETGARGFGQTIRSAFLPGEAPLAAGPRPLPGALPRQAAARMVDAARAERPSGWSLHLIDVDRFKAVNEALGDAAGEMVLEALGARFGQCLGTGDRMARLEGDRFLILAGRRRERAADFATRLLEAAREPVALGDRSIVLHASIGVVPVVEPGLPTQAALKQADGALRRAKEDGRNRFVLHEPGRDAALLDVSRLELDLAEAPDQGQLHLVYQGYVDLSSGQVAGFEALMRWTHPTRGELAPASFIGLAEASGLILPLGAWALRTALTAARRWPEHLRISVNVSALQFHQQGFVAEVEAALRSSGVAPERLELEITETVLMRDNPRTTAQLDALIAQGIRIALDDFGTGYSALAYLGRLPHHRIKLDRSFVQDLANPATLDLVRAILALAAKTGVSVTAEGVERQDQLEMVRTLGFSHAQGYVTGRPAPDPGEALDAAQPAWSCG